jgi:hypothetical protein
METNRIKLKNLIFNKKVVLVGPATYLNKKNFGCNIDSYDIVIRCNKGHGLLQDHINYGSRTDILYHCVSQSEDDGGMITDKLYNDISLIVFAYPLLHNFENSTFGMGNNDLYNKIPNKYNDKITSVKKDMYLDMEKSIGCRPNTGIIAIIDILSLNPSLLYITGFSMFKDGYSKFYRNKIDNRIVTEENSKYAVLNRMSNAGYVGHHKQYLIWKYLKNRILYNNKIKLDKNFFDILNFDISIYRNINNLSKDFSDEKVFDHFIYNDNNYYNTYDLNKLFIFNEQFRHYYVYNNNEYDVDYNNLIRSFDSNKNLKYKDYIVTILGYKNTSHTNYYPWNRFFDVFKTIGYKCEWIEINKLIRNDEKRIFITWNEPTCKELIDNKLINKHDIIFQKLTSLGKYDVNENWTNNANNWNKSWKWTPYKMLETYIDLGYNVYGFGCKTKFEEYPEKKRICEKIKDRIFWISWGGTPFSLTEIINSEPKLNNLQNKIGFVGSKWGKIGRGNVDAWDKYILPLEKHFEFNKFGGLDSKMVSDNDMKNILSEYKICPIIHAPSWQAERGVQDRFYTVFLCGRFGICDNLGAIDIFGNDIKEICTENEREYFQKTKYYFENVKEQKKYIELVQNKIKEKYNFYIQWYNIMCGEYNF